MTDHIDAASAGTASTDAASAGTASSDPTRTDSTSSTLSASAQPRSVRISTVIWGFILLSIAALFFTIAQFDLTRVNPGIIAAWVVIGIGTLAIIGGLVGAAVRRR